ncbi:hypothetical protein MJT46_003293 [Ovis ammon polii x Ovis aries]|nr:hypothetical protein MJT46_003293 [Ovis ammon polii x Ovis aries]
MALGLPTEQSQDTAPSLSLLQSLQQVLEEVQPDPLTFPKKPGSETRLKGTKGHSDENVNQTSEFNGKIAYRNQISEFNGKITYARL